jgi:hypothetical protein
LKIGSDSVKGLLDISKNIGFIDYEQIGSDELIFNGNLFRNTDINKINRVLDALILPETNRYKEIDGLLNKSACVPLDEVVQIGGTDLVNKLQGIGLLDINTVSNEHGEYYFVTKPSTFCKFTNSIVDDAFDLAKVFVTSLTYGMVRSSYSRGRITMIEALMLKLIAGEWVGPATAIGQDYKILELRGVLEVKPSRNGMFNMRLLKKDVGNLALSVIREGTTAGNIISQIPGASVVNYVHPERNRTIKRKNLTKPLKNGIASILDSLRTGSQI